MSTTSQFDLIIKNVRLVRPNQTTIDSCDIGVKEGRFAAIRR